jgi:AMP-polyphosphate phosphotransferase
MKPPRLAAVDLTAKLDRHNYRKRAEANQVKLVRLLSGVIQKKIPVIICFEGWDAAGKGGTIRRMVKNLDPRHYSVYSISKPTEDELARHYLWRFWRRVPPRGHIAVFDRSWYGRVLVERIEGFAKEVEWKRAFKEINDWEKQLVDDGAVMLKVFLHISKEEQQRRFAKRERDPLKQWKMNPEDYRNRRKWDRYETAIDEMFSRTHTTVAPWTLIGATDKRLARISVQDALIAALEKAVKSRKRVG